MSRINDAIYVYNFQLCTLNRKDPYIFWAKSFRQQWNKSEGKSHIVSKGIGRLVFVAFDLPIVFFSFSAAKDLLAEDDVEHKNG